MSTIHSSWVLDGCRSALIWGRARLSTVRSMAYRTQGRAMTPRPTHSRRPALGWSSARISGPPLPPHRRARGPRPRAPAQAHPPKPPPSPPPGSRVAERPHQRPAPPDPPGRAARPPRTPPVREATNRPRPARTRGQTPAHSVRPAPAARLPVEQDPHVGVEGRAVRHPHGRDVDEPPRPLDHPEHAGLEGR